MKELPNSLDAEKSLLGSILLDPQSSFPKVTLSKEDFYDAKHKVLFQALRDMYIDNYTLDMVTMRNYLQDNKLLESVGGEKYLLNLQDVAIVPSHVKHYQDIILDKSNLRREIKILSSAIEETYEGNSQADKVISELSVANIQTDEPLEVMGEKFIQDCIDGKVGQFDWWCNEWTKELGKMTSELMILHAPRSTGKTALMLQWILNSHALSKRTPLASIEMLKPELLPRMIANLGEVNTYMMRVSGQPTQNQLERSREGIEQIKALELCVRDKGMSIDDIRAWAISESRNGVDAIFIDNLLSISDGGKTFQSKTIMYDYFIRRLRDLRDDLRVPIILLAHPNSEGQVAWSRDVENFADVILYLEEVIDVIDVSGRRIMKDHDIMGDHVIAKFQKRRQGKSPIASLCFNKDTQTFSHVRWE